jgi:hypothetical protein
VTICPRSRLGPAPGSGSISRPGGWRTIRTCSLSPACGYCPRQRHGREQSVQRIAHAYLAAGRAFVLQLAHEPGTDHKSIDALTSKIEIEMLADGASLNLCRYSDEPFNTNEIIWPHWGMAPFHAPTLAAFGAIFALFAAPAIWLARRDEKAGVLCGRPRGAAGTETRTRAGRSSPSALRFQRRLHAWD